MVEIIMQKGATYEKKYMQKGATFDRIEYAKRYNI